MVEIALRLYFEAPALMRPSIFGSTLMRSRKPRLYKYLIKYSGSSNFGRTCKIKQLELWESPAMEPPLDEINPLWSSNIWLFENTFIVHSLSGSLATLMVGFWRVTRRRAIQPFFTLFNQLTSRMFRFYCYSISYILYPISYPSPHYTTRSDQRGMSIIPMFQVLGDFEISFIGFGDQSKCYQLMQRSMFQTINNYKQEYQKTWIFDTCGYKFPQNNIE